MKIRSLALILSVFGLCACTGPGNGETASTAATPEVNSAAGTLVLKNGTRLVGTIEKEAGGKIYFNADSLGQVIVDASVRVPAGAKPDRRPGITLKNGSMIVGTIQKQEAGKIYLQAELLGSLVIDATMLAAPAH